MAKKQDWAQVAIGAGIIAFTLLDVLPGDEVIGAPLGAIMILDGMRWL